MTKLLKTKLTGLGADKLASFIEKEVESNPDLKKRVRLMLDAASPEKLVKTIKASIQSIARSNRFIDWRESGSFSQSLDQILADIENHLLTQYPDHAITALDSFLAISEKVMNRCDDSNGSIGGEFRHATKLWGDAWANLLDFDGEKLADAIWYYMDNNDYGLVDNLVQDCAVALRRRGLDELDQLAKKHCLKNKDKFSVYHVMRDVAWLKGSPEALKEVFAMTGHCETESDKLDIARLLIKAWRSQEAIQLLESMDDTTHYGYPALDLLIEAYALEGNQAKTQQLRWRGFVNRSNLKYYHDYIKFLTTEPEKEKALHEAIELALNHHDLITSMQLLIDLGCTDKAADMLRKKYDDLDGRQYYYLKDIAKHFTNAGYPLESILIYRCLTEDILARAQSKYYPYAISYLKKSKELDQQVESWFDYLPTRSYFESLRKQHSRKTAFLQGFNQLSGQAV